MDASTALIGFFIDLGDGDECYRLDAHRNLWVDSITGQWLEREAKRRKVEQVDLLCQLIRERCGDHTDVITPPQSPTGRRVGTSAPPGD